MARRGISALALRSASDCRQALRRRNGACPITIVLPILAAALAVILKLVALAPAQAQVSQPTNARGFGNTPSSFPKTPGGPLGGPLRPIDKSQPLYLQGDELIYDTRGNRVIARGNVEIYYNNYILTADEVIYDQGANTLVATGNAQLKEPNGNIVKSDSIETTADFRDAFIQSLSLIGKDDTRIAARRAVRKDGNVSEFEQGKFTPCKSDGGQPPLWCISAQRIVHDQAAATITYQDAQFELFGTPILYLPYFQHADPSVKRRSGFLMPEFSSNSALGYGSSLPYYFAIAPNADFTFNPKYWSKQGVLYQGEWRHKVAFGGITGQYNVKLAGINQSGTDLPDGTTATKRDELDGWRGSLQTKGRFSLSSWWKFGWDVTVESDDTFRRFYKLDSILQTDRINTAWLQGLSERNHFSMQFYQFGGLLIEDSPASESRVHPVIDWNYIVGQPVLGGELSFNANTQSISRSDGTDSNRVSIDANWRRKLIDGIGQVWTPFAYAKADVTHFTNGFDPNTATPIAEDTITRAIGAVGIKYAFPFVAHAANGSHVVEPVAQIVARPASVSQRRLPDEDAKSLVWDDTLIFDVDKFSGWDRVETGTRANVGLQYTFQANTGGYARFIAGQSYHVAGNNPFTDPGVVPFTTVVENPDGSFTRVVSPIDNFSRNSGLDTAKSDYVLGAYLAPSSLFRLVSQSRFDDAELSLRRQTVYGNATLGPVSLNAQYTYMRDDPELAVNTSQQELLGGIGLRLTDRWSVNGSVRYDLDEKLTLQRYLALRYGDECFVLTASYAENHISNPSLDIKPDRTVMLRFELKHLGQFSYTTDQLDHVFSENQPPQK